MVGKTWASCYFVVFHVTKSVYFYIYWVYMYILSIYNLYFYVCNIVIAKDKCLRLIIFASILYFRKTNFNFLLQFFCCDRTFLLNYSKKNPSKIIKHHQKLLSFFYTNSPSYLPLSINYLQLVRQPLSCTNQWFWPLAPALTNMSTRRFNSSLSTYFLAAINIISVLRPSLYK